MTLKQVKRETNDLHTYGCESCGHFPAVVSNWHGWLCRDCANALDPSSDDFDHGY